MPFRAHTNVLGVDVSKHPASTVEVHESWPAASQSLTLRGEASNLDVGTLALLALDGKVLSFADRDQRTGARNENATSARDGDGLKVYLLLVEDMFLVESFVL
jgi:hypothetical protein